MFTKLSVYKAVFGLPNAPTGELLYMIVLNGVPNALTSMTGHEIHNKDAEQMISLIVNASIVNGDASTNKSLWHPSGTCFVCQPFVLMNSLLSHYFTTHILRMLCLRHRETNLENIAKNLHIRNS